MFGNQDQTALNGVNLNNNPYIGQDVNAQQVPQAGQPQQDAGQVQQMGQAPVNPQIPALDQPMGFDTNKFLIGLAIGAAGAYLLTNENAQKALFKTFAKGSELFTAGIEEMKERFEDAKAEMEANEN